MSENLTLQVALDDLNLSEFVGASNQNLKHIESYYPKLKIILRGTTLKAIGQEELLVDFEQKINAMIDHCNVQNVLSTATIDRIVLDGKLKVESSDHVILYGPSGNLVKAHNASQKKLVAAIEKHDLTFAIGPAGTGKTYTAVAMAVRALKNKAVKKIILTRPAVEAGENLGFLPGDLKEKLDPYLQPLYDALEDMISPTKLKYYFEERQIQIAPLAFMRGRTLDHAFVILDEAQNATDAQLKMFLTRMGRSAKFAITGDLTQVDLPKNQKSGLISAQERLSKIKEIGFINLKASDVIRHELVKKIIKAYE